MVDRSAKIAFLTMSTTVGSSRSTQILASWAVGLTCARLRLFS